MLLVSPETIGQWGERKLMSGFLQCQQAKIVQALNSASQAISEETLTQATQFIRETAGIDLEQKELSRLLDLYPMAKACLAENGWEHIDCERVVLDVIANSLLCSRWPTRLDQADTEAFIHNLKFAAREFGYCTCDEP